MKNECLGSPDNVGACDENEKKFLKKFIRWDLDEIETALEDRIAKLVKLEAKISAL